MNTFGTNTNTPKTALLIIDIQEFYFPNETSSGLANVEEASLKAAEVLKEFRANAQLVVHIKHKSVKGGNIHKNVRPLDTEKVITKTEINSFNGTDLLEHLQSNEINRLIIIGMQTNMCLEAATRASYDYGFECVVINDACAARDLQFNDEVVKASDVHNTALATLSGGGYSRVIDLEDFKNKSNYYIYQSFE